MTEPNNGLFRNHVETTFIYQKGIFLILTILLIIQAGRSGYCQKSTIAKVPPGHHLQFKLHYIDQDNSWAFGVMQTSLSDLNNDGKLDWTVGNCETDADHPLNFFWYEYKGADKWIKHTIFNTSPGAPCTATASIDINHDGWPDLISGRYLFMNSGGGASWTKYDIRTSTAENAAHDMFATDINGDGRKDVVCANWYTNHNIGIYWYEQPVDPTHEWKEHFISGGVPQGYRGLHAGIEPDCVGDFNGDGRVDIASALGWFEKNDNLGTSWTEHWEPNIFLGVDGTYHVAVRTAVRDLNGDGFPDIIQAECDTRTPVRIAWLKNDGHGKFTRHIIREGHTEDYHSLAVDDFDGDGDFDIVTGADALASGPTGHEMFYFENTAGAGHDPVYVFHNFSELLGASDAAALSNAFSTDHVHDIRFGDVNGDSRVDLILKGYLAAKGQKPAPFIYLENTNF